MKRLRLILILLAVVLIGGVALLCIRPEEPSYQGKTLSKWLYEYRVDSSASMTLKAEAAHAIRAIGTNALPTLLRMVASHDGAVKSKLISVLNSQKLVHFHLRTAEQKRAATLMGFIILRTNSLSAVPALIALTKDKDSGVRSSALTSLWVIDPGKTTLLPVLTDRLSDPDNNVRYNAAYFLLKLDPTEAELLNIYTRFPLLKRFRPLNEATNSAAASK